MNNIEEARSFIWELMNSLRGTMFCRELEFTTVRLVFIKYAVDNYIGATTVEDTKLCSRAQKMFSMRDVENGLEAIIPVLKYIDSAYKLNNILSGENTVNKLADELFGSDASLHKRNTNQNDYKNIMRVLSSVDFEEVDESRRKGSLLVEALIGEIYDNSSKYGFASEHSSRRELNLLASKILNVQSDDRYCDFVSGVGLSTLEIVVDKQTLIRNADCDQSSIAIATMLLIMSGFNNIDMRWADTLTSSFEDFKGNKLFVDPPFGRPHIKSDKNFISNSQYKYNDYVLEAIDKTINSYMEESNDAISVVTVNAGVLFRSNKQTTDFKKEIVERGFVKAVIALPPLKNRTAVNINLMVLTRAFNDRVTFINATECQIKNSNKIDLLPEESINMIVDVINSSEEIKGFSKVIGIEEIASKEYSLIPTMYVTPVVEEDNTTLEEVNEKLNELYKQLLGNS